MGPSTPHIGYNPESGSLSNVQRTIPRRPGRKGKYQLALENVVDLQKEDDHVLQLFKKRLSSSKIWE